MVSRERPIFGFRTASDHKMAGAESESIAVFARLKPVKGDETRGDVTIPKRFGKQKSMHVRDAE